MAIPNGCNHPCIWAQSYREGWERSVLNELWIHPDMWAFGNQINRWAVLAETMHAYHTCYLSVLTVHLEKLFLWVWSQVLDLWYFFCHLSTNRLPMLVPYMKPFCMLPPQKWQIHDRKMAPKTSLYETITDAKSTYIA